MALGASAKAPADMTDRVLAALEREALLGLASGEQAAAAHIVRSRVTYSGPSVIATLAASRWLRPLAAAAAIALVAGLSVWGVRAMLHRPATNLTRGTTPEAPVSPVVVPQPDVIAIVPTKDEPVEVPAVTDAPKEMAVAAVAPAPHFGMGLDRALVLAREGKLVIRVRAASAEVALARLLPHVGKVETDRALAMVGGGEQASVLAAVTAPAGPVSVPMPGMKSPERVASDGSGPTVTVPQMASQPTASGPTWKLMGSAYALHFKGTQRSLRQFLASLEQGPACAVSLDEAARDLTEELGVDPASMLWWQSTTTWEKRPAAAVVIETP